MKTVAFTFLLALGALASVSAQEQKPPATGGGGAAIESAFRLIGSVSGSKILEQGGRMAAQHDR